MKQVQHNLEVFTRDFATPIDYEIEVTSNPRQLLKGICGAVYICLSVAASATVAAYVVLGWWMA
jgi:hypothetical protein